MTKKTKEEIKHKYLYKTYGLTLDEWKEMSKHGCWMCNRTDIRLFVDHRHIPKYKKLLPEDKRKEVRGCLCFRHNTALHGLEKFKNARETLVKITDYFKVFKMVGDP